MPRGSVCYRRQCCARVRNISESCVPRGGRSGGKTDHCCPSNAPAPPALHPSQPATDSATTRARDRHLSSKWSSIRGSPGRRRRPRHRRWRRPPQPPSRVILARRDNAVVLRDALDGGRPADAAASWPSDSRSPPRLQVSISAAHLNERAGAAASDCAPSDARRWSRPPTATDPRLWIVLEQRAPAEAASGGRTEADGAGQVGADCARPSPPPLAEGAI